MCHLCVCAAAEGIARRLKQHLNVSTPVHEGMLYTSKVIQDFQVFVNAVYMPFQCIGLNDVIVEYSASPEGVTPDKSTMAAWANSYPDLESEDSSQEDSSCIYDEVKEDLSSSATENFTSSVPAGYSVPTLRPQYSNSVSEAWKALALQDGTNSEAPTLERSVSPPPDYHNLPSPLHHTFSGPGEGVARQTPAENDYMVWYGYLISPGEAFSHEATLQGTQNSTDTSTVE